MKDTPKKEKKKSNNFGPPAQMVQRKKKQGQSPNLNGNVMGRQHRKRKKNPGPLKEEEEEDKKCVSLFFLSWLLLLLLLMACQYHGPDSLSIRPIIQEPTGNDERMRDAHQGIVVFQQEVFLTVFQMRTRSDTQETNNNTFSTFFSPPPPLPPIFPGNDVNLSNVSASSLH